MFFFILMRLFQVRYLFNAVKFRHGNRHGIFFLFRHENVRRNAEDPTFRWRNGGAWLANARTSHSWALYFHLNFQLASPPRLGTPPTGIFFFPRLQDGGRHGVKDIDQVSGRGKRHRSRKCQTVTFCVSQNWWWDSSARNRCNVHKEVRAEAEMNDSASVSIGTSDEGGCGMVRLYTCLCVAATYIPEFCIHDMTCFSQSLVK